MGQPTKRTPAKKEKNRLPEKQSTSTNAFKPRNDKQREFCNTIVDKEVTIAIGAAGTGKTYCALATAFNLLGSKYKKIILCKSVTPVPGEAVGYLPGSVDEKMEPTMMSFTWNIDKLCGDGASKSLIGKKLIQILPLAFIRGISIDDSIVIIDEVQNLDKHLFKTIMTRIGENSKYIFMGDIEQIDRKNKSESCLETVLNIFKDSSIVGTVEFMDSDCVRNPIIPEILQLLRANGI